MVASDRFECKSFIVTPSARRLIRAYESCCSWESEENTFCRFMCSVNQKYYRESVETADLGWHCLFAIRSFFADDVIYIWSHTFLCYIQTSWSRMILNLAISSHLTSHTSILQSDVTYIYVTVGYWLGSNDIQQEGTWRFASTNQEMTYTNWRPGEPNNYKQSEDCLAVSNTLGWVDAPCNTPINYVCEKPAV